MNIIKKEKSLFQDLHTTVYTYGTLKPMLVRKLLVAYIMKIGSLKRLKSNIWCKILACLESALIQQMLDWDSVSPIMMKIQLVDIPVKDQQREPARARKPAWYKATHEDKLQYTSLLEEKLQDIPVPDSYNCRDVNCKMEEHSSACDGHVLDVMCAVMEATHACIPLSSGTSSSGKQKSCSLPGWKENVKAAKSNSLFWHSVWLSAGGHLLEHCTT